MFCCLWSIGQCWILAIVNSFLAHAWFGVDGELLGHVLALLVSACMIADFNLPDQTLDLSWDSAGCG